MKVLVLCCVCSFFIGQLYAFIPTLPKISPCITNRLNSKKIDSLSNAKLRNSRSFIVRNANALTHQSTSGKAQFQLTNLIPILSSILNQSVLGGFLAGGLHAVTGPDHLAALLPNSVGRSIWVGAKVGAIWGLGHGLSAIVVGLCAFFLKGKLAGKFSMLQKLTSLAENAVGASLVLIGLLGVKESLEQGHDNGEDGNESSNGKKTMSSGAIFANGVLHGFSWDGAPSIAPAVAMSSWRAATYFLLSYSLGTVIAMSISASTIGALSSKLGKMSQAPDFPKKLSLYSSMLAVLIGVYWIAQGFF